MLRGHLKIFFGYAAGVGKTYAMLDDAKVQYQNGVDVVIGYIKPNSSAENMALLKGIPALPYRKITDPKACYEFDLDAALERKPKLIIVDELAHTNHPGVRNRKRYQDIEELLNVGIDVYTTVDVWNIESLNDIVESITHVNVKETVPDYIFDHAEKVQLIDMEPDEIIHRNEEILLTRDYMPQLREIAMRKAADWISHHSRVSTDKTTNTKLLVCISSSPSSAKCIRWTARMAEALHAPWVVVYVENNQHERLGEESKKILQSNVELAEQLGAEVATLNGKDIATTVAQYAKLSGITNIVVGKSRNKKTLATLFEPYFEDKLISLLDNIEIHIIPDNEIKKKYRRFSMQRYKKKVTFSLKEALKMIGILAIITYLSSILTAFNFGSQNIILLYILAVLFISRVTSGYIYGITASILSVFLQNYFFMEPYNAFQFLRKENAITVFAMLITALITSTMTHRIKTQAELAQVREQRIEVLYEINKKLLVTRGLDHIVTLTGEYIMKLLERSVILYLEDPIHGGKGTLMLRQEDPDGDYLQSEKERSVAHWVFANQKRAGAGTDTFIEAKAYYVPILSQGNVLGVIGVACHGDKTLNHSNRAFLRRIGSLVAMALERQRLSDEQRQILIETEKEKMRSNLLRAISHDLRTPLTGILGASSAILENKERLDQETHDKLITNIKDDSQWLIRMVENLLSVTRINEDTANVTKTPEAAEEIMAAAISRIRKRFPNQNIRVTVPEELLMVPMDGTLIEQVIINLIENAIKHSGSETLITVLLKREDDMAVFEVSDRGEGIAEKDFPYLFESYVPDGLRTADSSRGMGIGLSICMSIVKAHQGIMEAYNQQEGGAVFRFSLPLQGGDENE
ncbi:MAG: histidine kinase [Firmicutes bacterium]|nr:histidine kinase [Bacillota bacterium]